MGLKDWLYKVVWKRETTLVTIVERPLSDGASYIEARNGNPRIPLWCAIKTPIKTGKQVGIEASPAGVRGQYGREIDSNFKFFYRKDFREQYMTEEEMQMAIAETTYMATGSAVIREINAQFSDSCEECGSKLDLEYHHITPTIAEVTDTKRNLRILCAACHRRKAISTKT